MIKSLLVVKFDEEMIVGGRKLSINYMSCLFVKLS